MDTFDAFLEAHPIRRYKKGEIVFQQGEIPKAVHVIKSGFVKVYSITAEGEERPVLFDVTYEVFPIGWIFNKIDRTYFYYEAYTDLELYLVPKTDYIHHLRTQPEELWRALDYYVERHVNYQLRMHALEQSKACDKVLYTLEFLARHFGSQGKGVRTEIDLPLTQQDFANFVGLTRETTSMELKKLQDEGVISYNKQHYIVHDAKLKQMLEDK